MFALADLRVFTEPQQGATYDELLAVAARAEQLGFGAFFRSDHYMAMGPQLDQGGLPGPTDAWTTLAGLARDTDRIRLGTLVSSATFRSPGVLAIQVAGVDQMSGGRVDLGLGAGWYQAEHDAYAIDFPPLAERLARLDEQLEIITGMWATPAGSTFEYSGAHFQVSGSPALPKPVQVGRAGAPGIPVIIGGSGKRLTPVRAARFADEFNTPFVALDVFGDLRQRVVAACEDIDRDPATMVFSAAQTIVVGATEADYVQRAAAVGRDPDELRANCWAGTAAEVRAAFGRWHDAGADRLYVQVLDLADLDHLDEIADLVSATTT